MAVGDIHVFPGFITQALIQLSFQTHRLLFSHDSEVRGKNHRKQSSPEWGYQTDNLQVMSLTRSPLKHRAGYFKFEII